MTDQVEDKSSGVRIAAESVELNGDLALPGDATGIVLFAHGSGSSRHSTRNKFVASQLNQAKLATLLFDLLTEDEEDQERYTRHLRFDIGLLADRLIAAKNWVLRQPRLRELPIGYFGASTGAAAALVAAAAKPDGVAAVVSRGGRPDLAGNALATVEAATLLIVGGQDTPVIAMNEQAMGLLHCERELRIVPGATHLFEEPGALKQVAGLARQWFEKHLSQEQSRRESG
jgi:pimeloyl-ACP methyl ester carboxylesterase